MSPIKIYQVLFFVGILLTFVGGGAVMVYAQSLQQSSSEGAVVLSPIEALGQLLYFDVDLSEPDGQACASCHEPSVGFDDPEDYLPVSEGVILGMFGGRNSPASSYAMYSPIFYFDEVEGLWIGGQFWDGRATGAVLGDPLADQALGPFMNPVEMHNPDKRTVVCDIPGSGYADLFTLVWGIDLTECDLLTDGQIEIAYDDIALSIAAFERTLLFGQFSSQYDAYLAACIWRGGAMDACAAGIGRVAERTGKRFFTREEWYGLKLFMGENNNDGILQRGEGAMCSACHIATWTAVADYALPIQSPAWAPSGWVPPVFSDFTYDNLGIPANTEFPFDPSAPPDLGLGSVLGDATLDGMFKVMTLRNIGLTGPYAHNGYFDTLKEIVHFYNTRDVPGSLPHGLDWPPAEVPYTVNVDELGNLGLSDADEDALIEFMKTLSDGYMQ